MLFTTRVLYQHAPDLEQEANLLFVRYYIAAPDQQLSRKTEGAGFDRQCMSVTSSCT